MEKIHLGWSVYTRQTLVLSHSCVYGITTQECVRHNFTVGTDGTAVRARSLYQQHSYA